MLLKKGGKGIKAPVATTLRLSNVMEFFQCTTNSSMFQEKHEVKHRLNPPFFHFAKISAILCHFCAILKLQVAELAACGVSKVSKDADSGQRCFSYASAFQLSSPSLKYYIVLP